MVHIAAGQCFSNIPATKCFGKNVPYSDNYYYNLPFTQDILRSPSQVQFSSMCSNRNTKLRIKHTCHKKTKWKII
ncbi:hypothetical protein COSHB9_01550 [Companilactobacillus alimentarius]